jgi:hypothetical protein
VLPSYIEEPNLINIEVRGLKRLWYEVQRLTGERNNLYEFVGVSTVDNFSLGFRAFRVLQFVNADKSVIIHVYDRQERSTRHEVKLMQLHQTDESYRVLKLERIPDGIPREIPNPMSSFLDQGIYEIVQRKSQEIPTLYQSVEEIQKKISDEEERIQNSLDGAFEQNDKNVLEMKQQIELLNEKIQELQRLPPETELLSMVDHRPKLLQAIAEAQTRIIIVSPWLNLTAVNKELQQAIRAALRRGISVLIGYGFGDDKYSQTQAIKALNKIGEQTGEKGQLLKLFRLNESHAKIVVCDEQYAVLTSFNWLSFAGREDLGNRVEVGVLVRDAKVVEETIDYVLDLFSQSSEQ